MMMNLNYLSKEQLSEQRKVYNFSNILNESKRQMQSVVSHQSQVIVFLSHKHDDGKILDEVIVMLKNLGVNVYVDWMDQSMPDKTSGETAEKIKNRIKGCSKFILLATEGAINSKWCNWELGYGDAFKYRDNIAIMPITDTRGGVFSGSEYLQIYPAIKTISTSKNVEYYVVSKNTEIRLEDWLKK